LRHHYRRTRRNLGERLHRPRRAAPRGNSRRDAPARLAVLGAQHRPFGGGVAPVPAWRHDGHQGQPDRTPRMDGSLPFAFAQPLMLVGLISLPVLWWLLRLMPPRPRRIDFPPTRLLFDIAPKEETPARTPWWLTLIRLLAAALVIFAAAGPIYNPIG